MSDFSPSRGAAASRWLPPLLPLALVTLLAELVVRLGWIPDYLLPAPSQVARTLVEDARELLSNAALTLATASAGLALSLVAGTLVATLLSVSDLARRALYPYAVFFQTVPIIALAPVLVIWFGYGAPTVIASAAICSVFPVVASTMLGLRSTDPGLVDVFRLYKASRFRLLWSCRLPSALPQILGGARIAAGLAVIGAVVGEFIAGGGLGGVVDAARLQQRIDRVFAAVLLSCLLGALLVGVVNVAARLALGRWHVSEREPGA